MSIDLIANCKAVIALTFPILETILTPGPHSLCTSSLRTRISWAWLCDVFSRPPAARTCAALDAVDFIVPELRLPIRTPDIFDRSSEELSLVAEERLELRVGLRSIWPHRRRVLVHGVFEGYDRLEKDRLAFCVLEAGVDDVVLHDGHWGEWLFLSSHAGDCELEADRH